MKKTDARDLEAWAASWTPDLTVADMLKVSVGRIAMRRLRQLRANMPGGYAGISIWSALPENDAVRHICDWITADFMAGAAWIDNVDDFGRPKKLMKCGTFDALTFEANKAMRKRLQGAVTKIGDGDEITVARLPGGYSMVRLMSPLALDVESRRMGHCVGQGAYDETVERGTTEIYSLRDRDGRPLVTIEVSLDNLVWDAAAEDFRTRPLKGSTRTVEQIQGPGNTKPAVNHMDVLRGFLAHSGWRGWEEWYRPEDPAMAEVRRRWEELRERDHDAAVAGFVDYLLWQAERKEEDHDGIQPTR